MAVVQVMMEMSAEAARGIAAGTMVRHGGVIYNTTGGIVEHLVDAVRPNDVKEAAASAAKASKSTFSNITKNLKNPTILITIGLGTIVVGGVIYYFTDKNKKKSEQDRLPEIPKYVVDYNDSVVAYLDAIRNGDVSLDRINCFIENIDALKANEKITFEFAKDNSETLVNYVYAYTKKLAEANAFEPVGLEEATSLSADNTLTYLRRYLEIQKQIFEEAA